MTSLEAPESEEEMARYGREVPGPKLANCLEKGLTPILPPERLAALGHTVAAHPLSLAASIAAMDAVLANPRTVSRLGRRQRQRRRRRRESAPIAVGSRPSGAPAEPSASTSTRKSKLSVSELESERGEGGEREREREKALFSNSAHAC